MEWAYVAGFVDGEGAVVVYRYKEKREPFREYDQLRLDMVQATPDVLYKIRAFLVANGCLSVSIFSHPMAKLRPEQPDGRLYRLSMASKHDLEIVIPNILPHMIVKRDKAIRLLEVLATKKGRVGVNRKRNDARGVNLTSVQT